MSRSEPAKRPSRRQFLQTGAVGAAALAAGGAAGAPKESRPNVLLIITDQQHIDALSATGNRHVQTPALDRLCTRGTRFEQSYCANPVCSPARSAVMSGRMPSEAGVHVNGKPIRSSIPNLGQWLGKKAGYEAIYVGKWHLPSSFTHSVPGFRVLTGGVGGQGNLGDASTSRAGEAFLRNRSGAKPFVMVASFFQPHDICQWLRLNQAVPDKPRFPQIEDQLPELPANFDYDPLEPAQVKRKRNGDEPGAKKGQWTKPHWRYYRYSYFRHVEMVDAEIGRVLRALEETGHDKTTLVLFTSDHGEGLGHHQTVRKGCLYDEAAKVPFIASWPGHIPEDKVDKATLVSGVDIMPTVCDYAGIAPPPNMRGVSLRPVLEGTGTLGRKFIVVEGNTNNGRLVRTLRHKYITYRADPVEQLFDVRADPGETKNLARSPQHAKLLAEHRALLHGWEARLDPAPGVPHPDTWRKS